MKRIVLLLSVIVLLAGCTGNATPTAAPAGDTPAEASAPAGSLTVTDGETQQALMVEALQALPQTEADLNDATYQGATLGAILEAAGVALDGVTGVQVVATDGYTTSYDAATVGREDVILAYSKAGGALGDDEVPFRMVVPGAENRMQARMVVEIRVQR